VLHFFPGLFSSDFLLSDLFTVLLSAYFSSDFVFGARFSVIISGLVLSCIGITHTLCSLFDWPRV